MNSFLFALFSFAALFTSGIQGQKIASKPLIPVDTLNLKATLGRWFAVYGSQLGIDMMASNAVCLIEDWSLTNGASAESPNFSPTNLVSIDIHLSYNQDTAAGKLIKFDGLLINNMFKLIPGKFLLAANGMLTGVMILAVGEIDTTLNSPLTKPISGLRPAEPITVGTGGVMQMNTLYPWVIVSDCTGSVFYVFARDVDEFNAKYKQIVFQKLLSLGFVGEQFTPVKIDQTGCTYPSKIIV